jgi:guanylate kinase
VTVADALAPLTGTHAGSLFLVVAPSGAGKSTLVNALLARDPNIQLSVSYTTREPRPGDKDGREYHFVSIEKFMQLRADGEFLESAEVHGNYYATSRKWIEERVSSGVDVLLEIDWQGARQVKAQFPHSVGIFILPPSFEALEARLRKRGQDTQPVIARRLLAAGSEMAHASEFDYAVINEDFETAVGQMSAIVTATRLRFGSQAARHHALFAQLGIVG